MGIIFAGDMPRFLRDTGYEHDFGWEEYGSLPNVAFAAYGAGHVALDVPPLPRPVRLAVSSCADAGKAAEPACDILTHTRVTGDGVTLVFAANMGAGAFSGKLTVEAMRVSRCRVARTGEIVPPPPKAAPVCVSLTVRGEILHIRR